MRVLSLLAILLASGLNAQPRLNEICSSNSGNLITGGRTYDWMEIVNAGHEPLALFGFGLSDNHNGTPEWLFPDTVLAPGAILLVLAAGDEVPVTNHLFAPLRIDADGEHIALYSPQGGLIDLSPKSRIPSGESISRYPDGSGPWYHTSAATPGLRNDEKLALLPEQLEGINVSHFSGMLAAPDLIQVFTQYPGRTIRYTTDGSAPVSDSPVWDNGTSSWLQGTDAPLSLIPTSDTWLAPMRIAPRARTCRWAVFNDDVRISKIISRSYFDQVNQFPEGFAVAAIQTEPASLFSDEQGIYVFGNHPYGNFHQSGWKWQRSGHLSFISDQSPVLEVPVNVRIHGRSSRAYPQKSLRINAIEDELIWPGETNGKSETRWILRTPDRMFSNALFVDDLVHDLVDTLNIDLMRSQPTLLFVNGEYWGIHTLRERLDQRWIEGQYGIDSDNVDIIGFDRKAEVVTGNDLAYQSLIHRLKHANPSSQSDYDEIADIVDIPSFIDYLIVQLFFANGDFPVNNVRLWKESGEYGRWRFLLFDLDASFRQSHAPLLKRLEESDSEDPVTLLFQFLSHNETFKQDFSSRFLHVIGQHLTTEKMLARIAQWTQLYEPEIPNQISRWHFPEGIFDWNQSINALRSFAVERPVTAANDIRELVPDPFVIYPNPADQTLFVSLRNGETWNPGEIVITDLRGSEVKRERAASDVNVWPLEIGNLPAGVYLIRLSHLGFTYHLRFIAQ